MPSAAPGAGDPAYANAYAISYRLLGDRSAAAAVARDASEGLSGTEPETGDRPHPLARIAAEAVRGSLEAASAPGGAPDGDPARRELRERFGAVPDPTRTAAALVHLAGYPEERVAEVLGIEAAAVRSLVAPLDPPPGTDWRALGDPELRMPRGGRLRRHRALLVWGSLAAVVVALVLWAATSSGERPVLGADGGGAGGGDATDRSAPGDATPQGSPEVPEAPDGTRFSAGVAVAPSSGCEATDPGSLPAQGDLRADGAVLGSYRIDDPGSGAPAPLLVIVGEPGMTSADLARVSSLGEIAADSIQVGIDPAPRTASPGAGDPALGGVALPSLLDSLVSSRCADTNRISVVGFGTGGSVAAELACSAADQVVAVAMVAGWGEPGCEPDPAVAVSIVGAADDPAVETGTALEEIGSQWATAVGAVDQEVDGRDEDTVVRSWTGPGGVSVDTTATVAGGHSWTVAASLSVNPFLRDAGRSSR